MYDDGKLKFLLSHGADYVVAHRLDDGAEIWRCGGLNPKEHYNPTLRLVASPATVPGLIVVPSAKNGPVVALRPDGKGDVTGSKEFVVWKRPRNTPDVPSPLIHDGLVYLCRENGDLLCLDAKTGIRGLSQADKAHSLPGLPRLRRWENLCDLARRRRDRRQSGQGISRSWPRTSWANKSPPRPRFPTAGSTSARSMRSGRLEIPKTTHSQSPTWGPFFKPQITQKAPSGPKTAGDD